MIAILGKKLGSTSIYNADGAQIPVTIVEAGPCHVTQIKTIETDGYDSVQLGYEEKKEKNTSAGLKGHFAKSGVTPKKKLKEFRDFEMDVKLGDTVECDIFEEGDVVSVVGTSKGKGFQGVVKRHGFSGVGDATHGQHNRLRAPGSIGAASYPARVFKGMRMAGRTGGETIKVKNLEIVKILKDKNILMIKGAIPGHKGALVIVEN